jgi:hypothetical protein
MGPETATTKTPSQTPTAFAMPGEFEATAAAFAAQPAVDGAILPTASAPDGSEVPAAVFGVAPAAGGPMAPVLAPESAPESAKAEVPAEMPPLTALPAITPPPMVAPMPAPRPAPLAARLPKLYGGQATTEAPATTIAPADRRPVQFAALAVPLPSMEAKPKFGRFVVLASYLKEAHARDAMKRGQAFAPRMARVRVRGKLYYRVVSGPYARSSVAAMRRALIGEGFPDAWTAKLCETTLSLAPCPTAPLPLNLTSN